MERHFLTSKNIFVQLLLLLTLLSFPMLSTAGLVAAYAFDEGTGGTANDNSGRGHPGALSNATWAAAGHSGAAVSFNGTNSWVTVADQADLRLTTGMTLEAWVKPASPTTGWRTVVFKETSGGLSYDLTAYNNGGPPAVGINTGGGDIATLGTAPLAVNVWSHLAATYDGGTLKLYVNGVLASSKAVTGALVSSTGPLRIGGNAIWGEYFSGLVDDVRIYDRALTAAEIAADQSTPVSNPPMDTTAPTVVTKAPAAGATGVALSTAVTAVFSEAIDPATLNASTFELRNAGGALVTAAVTYNAATNTAALTPGAQLAASATYTATLKGGAADPRVKDMAGNPLAANNAWTFTTIASPPTDTTAPTVTTKTPAAGATGVAITATITATFSEAIDPATLNATTFELRNAGGALVTATVTYNAATNTAALTPGAQLAASVTYTATLKGGAADPRVKDMAGNPLAANNAWTFTTTSGGTTVAGLVAAYAFDEGTGGTANDNSGRGHPGALSNATWAAAGHSGAAVSFNGTNSWVTVADQADLRLTTGMTLEAWVKPASPTTGWRTVVFKETSGGLSYDLTAYNNGGPPAVGINTGGGDIATLGTAPLAVNVWSHLAATYDGGTLKLYVNGVLASSKAVTGALVSSTGPLRIGGNAIWGEYFSGLVDDVRIYDRALTAAEIAADQSTPVSNPPMDTTAPTVVTKAPAAGATGVALSTAVTAVFSEAIDPATLNASTFELRNAGGALVTAAVTYNAATNTAALTPGAQLAASATYTATLKGGVADPRVKDMAGEALAANNTWSFITNANSSIMGEWGPKIDHTTVPVAAAVLPNGKLLIWSSWDRLDYASGSGARDKTYTNLFDPSTNQVTEFLISNTAHDMFCPGTSMLEDGHVHVSGGGPQVTTTSLYSFTTNQWVRDADMSRRRWYNTSTTLSSGQVFTLGGIPDDGIGELWTQGAGWQVKSGMPLTPLTTAQNGTHLDLSEYHPKLFVAPNGKLFAAGPSPRMHWYDTAANGGNGSVQFAALRSDDIYAQANVTVMYDVGKILSAGGNSIFDVPGANLSPSSKNAYLIDINNVVTARKIQPMHFPRTFANGVALPDGKVFVVGGLDNGETFSDIGSIMTPEMFDPTTETWTDMAVQPTPRNYHSVGLLLPDARVYVGGGGLAGNRCIGCNHPDAEIYSPPYLFKGIRPNILSAPNQMGYNDVISVNTTADVTRFSLIRLSSVTHTNNTDQRYLPVQATGNGSGSFTLVTPANANLAPPGYYMLFALNANGVPSVAKILQITGKIAPVVTKPSNQTSPLGAQVSLPISATSPVSETLTYGASGLPNGLSINTTSGIISGMPTVVGTFSVTVSVSGQRGGSSSTAFNWSINNPAIPVNVGIGGIATQSSTNGTNVAARALDGNTNGVLTSGSVTLTNSNANAWWEVDLRSIVNLTSINIWNRTDSCCVARLTNFYVFVSNVPFTSKVLATTQAQSGVGSFLTSGTAGRPSTIAINRSGRYLRIQLAGTNTLSLAEVEAMGHLNHVPVVTNPGPQTTVVGANVTLAIAASDVDGDALSYTATGLPAGLSLNSSTGLISGAPTAAGTRAVNVDVADGKGGVTNVSFGYTVNLPLTLDQVISPPQGNGVPITFTAVARGGSNPKYSWQFGDGSAATTPSPNSNATHTYVQPGRYVVTATVTDDLGATASSQLVQAVHYPATANAPSVSSAIIYEQNTNPSLDRVWNVNPDNDTVTVFNSSLSTKLAEIAVGETPQSLAIAPDGQIWVVNQHSGNISVINPNTLQVSLTVPLPAASQPYGLVFDPAGTHAYVSLEALGLLLQLDPTTGNETDRLPVGTNPRHLSVTSDGTKVFVSRFITPKLPNEETATPNTTGSGGAPLGGEVVAVNSAGDLAFIKNIVMQHSNATEGTSSGRGIPNYLGAPVISPDGFSAWVPSKQDNIKRGVFRDQNQLTFESTIRAISSRINLSNLTEDHPSRIDHDNSGIGSAAAFDNSGSYLFVALETSREVAVIDPYNHTQLMRINAGRAPQGLAFGSDASQDRLYVHNFMDRTVSAFDVTDLLRSGATQISLIATSNAVATEQLTPQVLLGKQMFYDARDTKLARDRYISCASCHRDGGHDGRVWDLTGFGEGLRNTVDLRGRAGMTHGRLHWSGNFDEVQDFEGQIRALAGGTGLMTDIQFNFGTRSQPLGDPKAGVSAELDALAAYVTSLGAYEPSPYRNPDPGATLTPDGLAGQALFTAKNCVSCHSNSMMTDSPQNLLHDIGTLKASSGSRLGIPFNTMANPGLDTPTLRGVWATTPYLHDGSVATIEEAILEHTNLPLLTTEEVGLLSAYIKQLDNHNP
jgi:large repetitive protein